MLSRERGSSRVWRRFTDDWLERPMFPAIDSRRRTRIETLVSRYNSSFGTGVSIRSGRRVSGAGSLLSTLGPPVRRRQDLLDPRAQYMASNCQVVETMDSERNRLFTAYYALSNSTRAHATERDVTGRLISSPERGKAGPSSSIGEQCQAPLGCRDGKVSDSVCGSVVRL